VLAGVAGVAGAASTATKRERCATGGADVNDAAADVAPGNADVTVRPRALALAATPPVRCRMVLSRKLLPVRAAPQMATATTGQVSVRRNRRASGLGWKDLRGLVPLNERHGGRQGRAGLGAAWGFPVQGPQKPNFPSQQTKRQGPRSDTQR